MTEQRHPEMLYRSLGRTGETVSAVGVGGFHLGLETVDEALAVRIVRTAVDRGITFMDNCWDYNDGLSEMRMGRALRGGYRERVFLMTKVDGRSKKEAAKQLDESLRRLQVDHIDLVQHHEVIRFEDPHRIFHEQGANAALLEARGAGKLRYIGFTGHKDPRIHLHMLDVAAEHGFAFDAVQMPLNVLDAHYRSFERQVLPRLVEQGIAVLGMKSMAEGVLLRTGTVTAAECLHYALNLPTSVVFTKATTLAGRDATAWRSQGGKVAFWGMPPLLSTTTRLYMYDASARKLASTGPFSNLAVTGLSWSPDGTQIAFALRGLAFAADVATLWTVDPAVAASAAQVGPGSMPVWLP
jgi:aryl-alcohol dehydrogenase-like predicted oxidoreductase